MKFGKITIGKFDPKTLEVTGLATSDDAQPTPVAKATPDPGSPCTITISITQEDVSILKTLIGVKGEDLSDVVGTLIKEQAEDWRKALHLGAEVGAE
jgi:hypothetical protein